MSVVGYTYAVENRCGSCTVKAMSAAGIKVQRGKPHEEAIEQAAEKLGIDFSNERSYDSANFPKVITEQSARTEITERPDGELHEIEDELCDSCGKWMVLGRKPSSERALVKWLVEHHEQPKELAKSVAAELRAWGLRDIEHISEGDVQLGARQHPHDFRTLVVKGRMESGFESTPEFDGVLCFDCDAPWENHRFDCDVCKQEVGAIDVHRHQVAIPGQIAGVDR